MTQVGIKPESNESFYGRQIARCEQARDTSDGEERMRWSTAIDIYKHLRQCPNLHSGDLRNPRMCKDSFR